MMKISWTQKIPNIEVLRRLKKNPDLKVLQYFGHEKRHRKKKDITVRKSEAMKQKVVDRIVLDCDN